MIDDPPQQPVMPPKALSQLIKDTGPYFKIYAMMGFTLDQWRNMDWVERSSAIRELWVNSNPWHGKIDSRLTKKQKKVVL